MDSIELFRVLVVLCYCCFCFFFVPRFSLYCYFKLFDKMFVALLLFQTDYDHFTALHFRLQSMMQSIQSFSFCSLSTLLARKTHNIEVLKLVFYRHMLTMPVTSIGCTAPTLPVRLASFDGVFVCLTFEN